MSSIYKLIIFLSLLHLEPFNACGTLRFMEWTSVYDGHCYLQFAVEISKSVNGYLLLTYI